MDQSKLDNFGQKCGGQGAVDSNMAATTTTGAASTTPATTTTTTQATGTVNVLNLYITAARKMYSADIDDANAWADVSRLMLYLRQALTCFICGGLLHIPMTTTVPSPLCQHNVCKDCIGSGKLRAKWSCPTCKDQAKFVENTQLRVQMQSYKRLCEFANRSEIATRWGNIEAKPSPSSPIKITGPTNFQDLLSEGCNLEDVYTYSEPKRDPKNLNGFSATGQPLPSPTDVAASPTSQPSTSSGAVASKREHMATRSSAAAAAAAATAVAQNGGDSNGSSSSSSSSEGSQMPLPSATTTAIEAAPPTKPSTSSQAQTRKGILASSTSTSEPAPVVKLPTYLTVNTKILSKTTDATNATSTSLLNGGTLIGAGHLPLTTTLTPTVPIAPAKPKPKRRGCRCGLATPTPGKLTCCGQRCPCYVDGKGCFECKCRGCRNPHKANPTPGVSVQPATKLTTTVTQSHVMSKPNGIGNASTVAGGEHILSQSGVQSAHTLLSPNTTSLLLSTTISPSTLNHLDSTSLLTASPNGLTRLVASTASPPTAFCVIGTNGQLEPIQLPFPKLEESADDLSASLLA